MKLLFLVAAVSALWLPSLADARDWRGSGAFLQIQAQRPDQGRDQYRRGSSETRRADRRERDQGRRGRMTEKEPRIASRPGPGPARNLPARPGALVSTAQDAPSRLGAPLRRAFISIVLAV